MSTRRTPTPTLPRHPSPAFRRPSRRPLAVCVGVGLAAAGLTACAEDEKKTEAPVAAADQKPEPLRSVEIPDEDDTPTTGINIDASLAELCGIARQETYFEFDSDDLEPRAVDLLARVADCVEDEDLPGLVLAGHADPRGTERYNFALAERRAESVAGYLEDAGLGDELMMVQSFGESKAHDDPAMWDTDRRVDIEMVDGGMPMSGPQVMGQGGGQQ